MSNPIHILYFILCGLFWGISFIAIRVAIEHYPPVFAAFLRTMIALVVVGFYIWIQRGSFRRPKVWLQSVISGTLIMGLAWVFLFWGEQHITPAMASILNGAVPIFATILTPLITPQDKLSWNKWAGVLIGFVGVSLIFAPEISWGMTNHLKGLLAVASMALCYAIGVLWTRRLTTQVDNKTNLFYQCIGSAIFLLSLSVFIELPHTTLQWSWPAISALLYLGIFSTAIAWLMFYRLLKEVGSIQATASTYLVPLVAIFLDIIFLKKWLLWNQAVGACIILGSVFLINRKTTTSPQ